MSRLRCPLMLLCGASAAGAACSDAPTAGEPFSLAFDRLPFTAVVLGDTLRDTSGAAVLPGAVVYGGDGSPIADAEISYLLLDRGATLVDGRWIVGDSLGATVRVVAEAAGIPSLPVQFQVVPRPDSLSLETAQLDTARYQPRARISPEDTTGRIEVRVLHRPQAGEPVGVARWLVHYDVELFDGDAAVVNDSLAIVVGEGGRASVLDTTDAEGRAWRQVTLNGARTAIDAVDSLVVSVTILGRPAGTVIPSRVRLAVPVRPR